MWSRPYSAVAVLFFLAGCNLILPELPSTDAWTNGDTDTGPASDAWTGTDSAAGPDLAHRPDVPPAADSMPWEDAGPDTILSDVGDVSAPPLWECQVPMELLSPSEDPLVPSVETSSFTAFGAQAQDNFIYVYYSLCNSETSVSGPERGWLLQVDQIADLRIQVDCEGPCWAYLMKDGCNYQNTEACWSPHDIRTFSWDALPGIWYIAVEQMEIEGTPAPPDWTGPPFDIHVALNRTHGSMDCVEDEVLSLHQVLATGTCESFEGRTWRTWTREGNLPNPGEGPDRAWLPCLAGASPVDPVGGMPEYLLRIDADPTDQIRLLDITATLDPGGDSLPDWSGVLGMAGGSCGETEALVDCDGGQKKTLRMPDLTLLPGQEAFLYLDGAGAEALGGPLERSYRLDVRIEADCIP